MNELAFVSVGTLPRRLFVPLLAHFSLVVLVELLWSRFHDQLSVAVGVSALLIELACSRVHVIPT